MPDRTNSWSPKRLLVGALLISSWVFVGLPWKAGARPKYHAQAGMDFRPFRHLPSGAKIKDRHRDVVFADLDGDGQQEVVIFYTIGSDPNDRKANILVLKPNGVDYVQLWESTFDGSWGFTDPSGVYDLNKSGRPQIIAYRQIGASCPGFLEIYEYRDGRIERLTGKWGYKGHCEAIEIRDLDSDRVSEIIVVGSHGASDDIYRWNGRHYVRSNGRFPQHYNAAIDKVLKDVYSRDASPASARVNLAIEAVRLYTIQKRYEEAIRLCRDVLRMMADTSMSQPDSVYPGTKGLATIHKLLGDTYKAAGNFRKAQEEYQKAQGL